MIKAFASAILVIAPLTVSAQPKDPKFEYGKAEEVEKVSDVEWNAQAEAGVVFTTGNSKTTTVAAGLKVSRKTGANKLALEGSTTYAKSSIRSLRMGADHWFVPDVSKQSRAEPSGSKPTTVPKCRHPV